MSLEFNHNSQENRMLSLVLVKPAHLKCRPWRNWLIECLPRQPDFPWALPVPLARATFQLDI